MAPWLVNSTNSMPYAHTSDLMVNCENSIASGAVHFTGNLAPKQQHQTNCTATKPHATLSDSTDNRWTTD